MTCSNGNKNTEVNPNPDFVRVAGEHCMYSSYASLFNYLGGPVLDEAAICASSGHLELTFHIDHPSEANETIDQIVRGFNESHLLMEQNLGVRAIWKEAKSKPHALQASIELSQHKTPHLVMVDEYYLSYRKGAYLEGHSPHYVIIVDCDEESTLISDTSYHGRIPTTQLLEARGGESVRRSFPWQELEFSAPRRSIDRQLAISTYSSLRLTMSRHSGDIRPGYLQTATQIYDLLNYWTEQPDKRSYNFASQVLAGNIWWTVYYPRQLFAEAVKRVLENVAPGYASQDIIHTVSRNLGLASLNWQSVSNLILKEFVVRAPTIASCDRILLLIRRALELEHQAISEIMTIFASINLDVLASETTINADL